MTKNVTTMTSFINHSFEISNKINSKNYIKCVNELEDVFFACCLYNNLNPYETVANKLMKEIPIGLKGTYDDSLMRTLIAQFYLETDRYLAIDIVLKSYVNFLRRTYKMSCYECFDIIEYVMYDGLDEEMVKLK